jgi:hypothetical protein
VYGVVVSFRPMEEGKFVMVAVRSATMDGGSEVGNDGWL